MVILMVILLTMAASTGDGSESDQCMASNTLYDLGQEVQHLDGLSKQRYLDKLNFLQIQDPYLMPNSMFVDVKEYEKNNLGPESVPDMTHHDIFHYLIDKYV